MQECDKCEDTGVWLASDLDDNQLVEKCDSCCKFKTDSEAAVYLASLIYTRTK